MANALLRTSAIFIGLFLLVAGLSLEVEGEDAVGALGPLQHLGMVERAAHVAVAARPVLLHGAARELVVLGRAFIAPGLIDQVDDVVDLVVGLLRQELGLCRRAQLLGHLVQKLGGGAAQRLQPAESVGAGAGAAGI